jgi:hypothetical protein
MPGGARSRVLRCALNLWVVLHFIAILAAAGSVGPTSGLVIAIWGAFRPYLQGLYLNQGYNFFAPEPAPSTLLKFEAEREDGTVVRGRIDDRSIQPRLLYHRRLLLTEHIGVAPPELHQNWYASYARHLCRNLRAARIRLTRLTHYPLAMESVRNGARLDEPTTYDEMDLGVFSCGDR